jgi:peptide/nickel transport system ATP-binding protein
MRHNGKDISDIAVRDRNAKQIASLQMVFQNPFRHLEPEPFHRWPDITGYQKFGVETDKKKIFDRVMRLLDTVKLPRDFYFRKPRQLSGGQKQRIGIARAFAGNPSMVIADEPVSALDVSVAAAVTELLMDIQRKHKTTLLFISHDLSVVRYLSDRIVVMYLGHILERGTTKRSFPLPITPIRRHYCRPCRLPIPK